MSLLSSADQQQLRESFAALVEPVTIVFFSQAIGCETCGDTRQILREVTELTDKVTVDEVSLVLEKDRAAAFGVERVPALVLLAGADKRDTRIRFLGAPEGWDFMALLDAILLAGGAAEPALSEQTVLRLGQMTEDVSVLVFVTPT
jgi:alkyl hydroperoxide reductase subunit AhpF